MQEQGDAERPGSGTWTLTVWLEGTKDYSSFTFDEEPAANSGSKILSYQGMRDGRQHSVHINMDKATHWTLVEDPEA